MQEPPRHWNVEMPIQQGLIVIRVLFIDIDIDTVAFAGDHDDQKYYLYNISMDSKKV